MSKGLLEVLDLRYPSIKMSGVGGGKGYIGRYPFNKDIQVSICMNSIYRLSSGEQ